MKILNMIKAEMGSRKYRLAIVGVGLNVIGTLKFGLPVEWAAGLASGVIAVYIVGEALTDIRGRGN